MKLIGNIICTIAILTQIVMSAGFLLHAPDCQAGQSIIISDASESMHDHCGCGHHHHAPVSPVSNDLCYSIPDTPEHDCTCTPQKTYPYVLGDHIAEQKSKEQLLDASNFASIEVSFSQLAILFCKSNQSNAPPPQTDYLPQHNPHFTSIHLGVFLI